MSLWHCRDCSTAYAVGLRACPHCQSTHYTEEPVPKITRHGGPTVAGAHVIGGAWGDDGDSWPEEAADTAPARIVETEQRLTVEQATELREHVAEHGVKGGLPHGATVKETGGEGSSPGSSSKPSPRKSGSSQKSSAASPRKRARTTGSRSTPPPAEGSSARSTDGAGPTTPDQ